MPYRALVAVVLLVALALLVPAEALAQGQPLIVPGQCSGGGSLPVCAVTKRTLVTYMNDCTAIAARARVVSYRACHEGCPRRYAPVCAIDAAGKRATFGNVCEAERSGAKIVRNRGCQGVLGRR